VKSNIILGLDIGGTGIKGALVDVETGKLVSERVRYKTPSPAYPDAIAEIVQYLVEELNYDGDIIGCGFPAIVVDGVAKSASNIDKSWIDTSVEDILAKATGKQVVVINDADAAGVGEAYFGSMQSMSGVSMLLTLGTGIGSALFVDGTLVPNTEFGHIHLKSQKVVVEKYASNAIRKKEDLSYEEWASRLNKLFKYLGHIFSPKVIVLGGGISKKFDDYREHFEDLGFPIQPATLLNQAGLIGAAYYAAQKALIPINQED
jgi:polyphosphate glucokinase